MTTPLVAFFLLATGCTHQYPYVAAVYQDGPQLYVKTCNVAVAGGRVHDIETGCRIDAVEAPPLAPPAVAVASRAR